MLNFVIGWRYIVETCLDMEMNRKSLFYKVDIMSKKLLSSQTKILSNFSKKNRKKSEFRKCWTSSLGVYTS